jgi:hypothetical protein
LAFVATADNGFGDGIGVGQAVTGDNRRDQLPLHVATLSV